MQIGLIGVGLIGGSIGLAARSRVGAHVHGWDPGEGVLGEARRLGVVDHECSSLAQACERAELIFACTPVSNLPATIGQVLQHAPDDCVVSDVGSTKRSVAQHSADQRFVGGHPLAGAETAGVRHAREDLFERATWYLTPISGTSGVLYERLHRAVSGFGAQPTAIDADAHDSLMASISHLPHVLANVLVAQAAGALERGEQLPATGPSFRDATRVAGASGAIWPDIYLANRDALIERLDDTSRRLEAVRALLAAGERQPFERWNDEARGFREALLGAGTAAGPLHELRAAVPNRPGVIAEIALALGREGVNIVDLVLSPSADNSQGQVALWVRGEQHAQRACELMGALDIPVVRA